MGETDPENPKYNLAKFEYDARVALVASESWINVPDYLYLSSGGNNLITKFLIMIYRTVEKEKQKGTGKNSYIYTL